MRFLRNEIDVTGPPCGTYRAIVTSVDERESEKGNDLVIVNYEVLDGDWTGEWVRDFFVVGGANRKAFRIGRRRLVSVLRAAEVPVAAEVDVDLRALVDRVVILEIVDGEWQGQRVPRIKTYRNAPDKTRF